MLKLLRYTLAAIFLATSVGCLGLWWRSETHVYHIKGPINTTRATFIGCARGGVFARLYPSRISEWDYEVRNVEDYIDEGPDLRFDQGSYPAQGERHISFPLWYPALVFALATVGVLRLKKPFTIRSALIATTIVALLLGMIVVL